ncbi:unnamed protein product [Chilo suppressalis]|uniref:THAP-type domain-containing protein n=1 Tax=Chilo suppressalis TaxID=168631 RepID=A0ABN8BJM4_CHISP|nr:unnamed protein product [Chilo suppressalis]
MSQKLCCVPGCVESGDTHPVLHLFPNPDKYPDRFRSWVMAVGGDILGLRNLYIYANRRVCHRHFEINDCCRYNKLTRSAIPRKHLWDLHKVPQFTIRDRRHLSAVENKPSTSTDTSALFGPVFNMSHHLFQESMPSITKDIGNKENVAHSSLQANVASVTKPTTMDIEYNICISDVQMPTQKPSSTTNPLEQMITEPVVVEHKSTENTSVRKIVNLSAQPMKRLRKRVPVSKQEEKLYKKLRNMQIKLSKCRNKYKKYAASVRMSSNVMTNQSFLKTIENMTSAGRILTLLQFREIQKKSKGRRFTLKEKITSLFLYKKSPKAYRLLRKILILPAPQTLEKLVRKAVITPGINEKVFHQLKNKSKTMKKEDTYCVLLFDEVSLQANVNYNETQDKIYGVVVDGNITKFANHATVFMIRGLIKNYKQPIAYTFCNGATKATVLKDFIKEIISKLQEAGFQVIATVCDQGTNNQKAIKSLIEDKRQNLLVAGTELKRNTFDVNGNEIIPLYDPPHLLKGIRNNLINKNLKYVNEDKKICVAKWEHLRLLHAENPAYKGIRLIPKLTDQHIIPEKMGKMRVKFATQVFSQTVSSNMGYLADKGLLPTECKDTADVLLLFDKLFDSMNGSYAKKTKYGKQYLKPLTPNSAHIKLWHEAKKIKNL